MKGTRRAISAPVSMRSSGSWNSSTCIFSSKISSSSSGTGEAFKSIATIIKHQATTFARHGINLNTLQQHLVCVSDYNNPLALILVQRFLHSQSFPVDTNLILFLTTSPLSLSLFLKTHLVPITNWFLRVCSWFQTLFFVNRLSSSSIVVAQEISLSVSSFFYSSIVERSVALHFVDSCFLLFNDLFLFLF